jgi:hypothetical protein
VSLTTVINCLIKSSSRTRGAPIQAEAIIEKMLANDDYAFKPDTITYTSLIKCWSESRRPTAAKRAEEIIELLHKRYDEGHEECKPDSTAYNVALNAIAKSGVKDSAQRAEGEISVYLTLSAYDCLYSSSTSLQSFTATYEGPL